MIWMQVPAGRKAVGGYRVRTTSRVPNKLPRLKLADSSGSSPVFRRRRRIASNGRGMPTLTN